MYSLENITSGRQYARRTRFPVIVLVLGTLVLNGPGSASSLDSGWSLLSGHDGIPPSVHRLGKQ